MPTAVSYRVDLLPVAWTEVPGPQVYWMADWDRQHRFRFQVALIRGHGLTALVNGGPAEDLTVHFDAEHGFFGEGSHMWREDGEFIVDQLERHGLAPADVTHLILTPLTLYTTVNVERFTNARIAISKTGWVHFHVTHEHPHDARDTIMLPHLTAHLVTDAWPRVRLLEDEDELAPGLRTWWTGAHHRSSICVDVDTDAGLVSITDAVFVLGNLERDHPIGICSSLEEAIVAQRRLRESGAIVLPLYDPGNFERHPGGAVTGHSPAAPATS
jgi:hypothetical protein